jgi:anti-anti-sigma regulatory factor
MILTSLNKPKQLLIITFVGRIEASHVAEQHRDVLALTAELEPGFRLLADLTPLESMSADCAPGIAKVMEVCGEKGVKLIVRVIPDSTKDIGLTILSRFHYHAKPRMIVCATLAEAGKHLGLL